MFSKGTPNPYHKKSVEARKAKGGYVIPWNKGLNKHQHPSIMIQAKTQLGCNNSIFKRPDAMEFLYENGLKTREAYRGSKDNPSPKWHRQFGVNQDKTMLKRCNYTCENCCNVQHTIEQPLESDHIIPAALGGETKISNGQMLCRFCHLQKTNVDKKLIRQHFSQDIVRS